MNLQRHPSWTLVSDNFHVLLSHIEELYEKHEFHGSADKLFAIVEKCTVNRPVRVKAVFVQVCVALVRTHADRFNYPVKRGCDFMSVEIHKLSQKTFETSH